jgi:hypothetical protein
MSDTNYIPDESILDLTNCPPEQVQFLNCRCCLCYCGLQKFELYDTNLQDIATAKLQQRQELFKAGC